MKKIFQIGRIKFLQGKNIKGFSFFVIAAFLFLLLSKLSETYTQNIDIQIRVNGLNDEMRLVNDSTNKLDVLVKARGFSFVPFMFSKPRTLYLDFNKDVKKANKMFSWDAFNNAFKLEESLGKNIEVLSVNPDTLYFKYDLLSYKYVPIKVQTDFSFASGYDLLNSLEQNADSVKVVGLEDELKQIEYVETDLIILKNISVDFKKNVEIVLPKGSDIEVVPNNITLMGKVARFTEGEIKVPIELINVPKDIDINFFPKEVNLFYYVSLDNYKNIKSGDFKVICDYAMVNETNQQFLLPRVEEKPLFVKSTRLGQDRIEFILME